LAGGQPHSLPPSLAPAAAPPVTLAPKPKVGAVI
jgi:hypothetical protein